MRPLIGITCDEFRDEQRRRRFVLDPSYAAAVARAGGMPVMLGPLSEGPRPGDLIERLDGLVITGGAFDILPSLYGQKPHPDLGELKPERTSFEFGLLRHAAGSGLPVLGICNGAQLMNVYLGGDLFQHLPEQVESDIDHAGPGGLGRVPHAVTIEKGTLLHRVVGCDEMPVYSSHHQAADRLGDGLLVGALAADGVIEAIESPEHPFFLGVQWHPEENYRQDGRHLRLFEGVVQAGALRTAARFSSGGNGGGGRGR